MRCADGTWCQTVSAGHSALLPCSNLWCTPLHTCPSKGPLIPCTTLEGCAYFLKPQSPRAPSLQTGTDRITPCWRTSPPPRSCHAHMKCLTSKSYCHVRGNVCRRAFPARTCVAASHSPPARLPVVMLATAHLPVAHSPLCARTCPGAERPHAPLPFWLALLWLGPLRQAAVRRSSWRLGTSCAAKPEHGMPSRRTLPPAHFRTPTR